MKKSSFRSPGRRALCMSVWGCLGYVHLMLTTVKILTLVGPFPGQGSWAVKEERTSWTVAHTFSPSTQQTKASLVYKVRWGGEVERLWNITLTM